MKRNPRKPEKNERPRRLTLSRETIQILNDPSLLELVHGGTAGDSFDPFIQTTTESGC